MRKCAYLTMENPEGFFVYDNLTIEPLQELGWDVVDVPWSKPGVDWSAYDAVVIRSPWDYQDNPQEFIETLEAIERCGALLFNSLAICRWNMDKVYLKDLNQRGVPIVPTQWFDRLGAVTLDGLLADTTDDIPLVLKPTIGANADGVYVLKPGEKGRAAEAFREYAEKPVMAQPFLKSINTVGEYSLFYFGGEYSHAILKQPKDGDFRVQEEHGGQIKSTIPDEAIRKTAETAIEALGETLLYARVDIVILNDGSPALIELELIEPSLYFSYDDKSAGRFASALNRMRSE
ncbi:MAG: RimK family alpha-L-glutamate ligase [Planctomycetaceae bacterium]